MPGAILHGRLGGRTSRTPADRGLCELRSSGPSRRSQTRKFLGGEKQIPRPCGPAAATAGPRPADELSTFNYHRAEPPGQRFGAMAPTLTRSMTVTYAETSKRVKLNRSMTLLGVVMAPGRFVMASRPADRDVRWMGPSTLPAAISAGLSNRPTCVRPASHSAPAAGQLSGTVRAGRQPTGAAPTLGRSSVR